MSNEYRPTREALTAIYDELVFFDPPQYFDHAIVGVVTGFGQEPAVLYDEAAVLTAMAVDLGDEGAREWFDFNTIGSYVGPATPRFLLALLACVSLLWPSWVSAQVVNAEAVRLSTGPCFIRSGAGSPEGVLVGSPCDSWMNTQNGQWYEKITGTATNTGWFVGFNTAARVNGNLSVNGSVGAPGYVSQLTAWNVEQIGFADFRYLYTDELHARTFIADNEAALLGLQIIAKSVSPISQPFTCPANNAQGTLWVDDIPGSPGIQIFQFNDFISVRNFSRSGGGLDISDCIGTVSSPTTPPGGSQSWLFTRVAAPNGGAMQAGTVIQTKSLALDYGTDGSGYAETNAIDGPFAINSPYQQTVVWFGSPAAANRQLRTRTGNLRGVTGLTGEYGFFAVGPQPAPGQASGFLRASNASLDATNIDVHLYDGFVEAIRLDSHTPSLAIGYAVPTSYASGNGLWMGRDLTDNIYKFRIGNPVANRLSYDGTTLSVVGEGGGLTNINGANIQTGTVSAARLTVGSGTNQIRNADCGVSLVDWSLFTNSGFGVITGNGTPPWSLNGHDVCFATISEAPAAGTVTAVYTTNYPVVAGNRYEASVYLGIHRSGGTFAYLQFFDAVGNVTGQSNAGSVCGPQFSGGPALAGYCRSYIIANAPAGSQITRLVVQTNHTGEPNPYMFWVHAFFGEGLANQTEPTPWGPAGVTEIVGGLITTRTIHADRIIAGTITATEIAAATITGTKIAGNTITGGHIQGNTITAGHLQANSITGDKLVVNSITSAHIQAGAISADKIQAGAITADKINVGALSAISANMGSVTAGSIAVQVDGSNLVWMNTGSGVALGAGGTNPGGADFRVLNNGTTLATLFQGGHVTIVNEIYLSYLSGPNNRYACVDVNGYIFASNGGC